MREIAESARALTGASCAAIATIDEAGAPKDFVTSGFTEAQHRAIAEWSEGPRLFEHFRDLEGPIRIADTPGHLRALGFSPDRLARGTFQGTPMRHRGGHVGHFYLVEKEGGGGFTDEDEEVLVLFASRAAAAIANARNYRAERPAARQTDIAALVDSRQRPAYGPSTGDSRPLLVSPVPFDGRVGVAEPEDRRTEQRRKHR